MTIAIAAIAAIGFAEFQTYCALEPAEVPGTPESSPVPRSDIRIESNPAGGPVEIQFAVPVAGVATVDILDAQRRLVRQVLSKQVVAGNTSVAWDGRDGAGRKLAGGVYFVRVKTPSTVLFERITIPR